MDTFAALALGILSPCFGFLQVPNIAIATDPPSPYVLDRKPDPKSAPLITLTMWKMIIGQAVYQLAVTLVLHFNGQLIFLKWDSRCMQTVVFNTFVFMQIFNQYKQVVGFPPGRIIY
jgi:magnesium-transporting ATPase (P-type)